MSEEVKIKISQPMFEVGELERFDNNIHNIVAEYSKLMFKEKDQILTQRIIMKQEEEIERLNKELEIEKDISDGMLETIDKALHKLRASKDHFKTERENNVVTFVIRILEGNDK